MPDPRNLQIVDRGNIPELFTSDLNLALTNVLTSPRASNILQKALAGQSINVNEFLSIATRKQQNAILGILARNANRIVSRFETDFDPMLAFCFHNSAPRAGTSIWVAPIEDLVDRDYYLEAVVHDAAGNLLDQIQEAFTVDTTAPEADIEITAGDANAAVYWNKSKGAYIATARNPGAALLNITGKPKFANVGAGEGYLFYQEVGLDADGMPTGTWMPLTVENTMLSSGIWQALLERQGEDVVKMVKGQFPQLVGGLDDASILGLLRSFTPMTLVETISATDIQNAANSVFKGLGLRNFNFTPRPSRGDPSGFRGLDRPR